MDVFRRVLCLGRFLSGFLVFCSSTLRSYHKRYQAGKKQAIDSVLLLQYPRTQGTEFRLLQGAGWRAFTA